MKCSIVTISYNQVKFLPDCIASIASQDYHDLEHVIIDACSTDGTDEVLRKYLPIKSKVIVEKDKGAADGLNKGFANCTGDIFGYINSDDVLLPGAITHVMAFFGNNPDIDILSGQGYIINQENYIVDCVVTNDMSPRRMAYGASVLFQQATFFRAQAFKKSGGFNIGNKTCWDAEILLRMLLGGAGHAITDQYLACFRIHNESITGTGRLHNLHTTTVDRLFQLTMNRVPNKIDRLIIFFMRYLKYVVSINFACRALTSRIRRKIMKNTKIKFSA